MTESLRNSVPWGQSFWQNLDSANGLDALMTHLLANRSAQQPDFVDACEALPGFAQSLVNEPKVLLKTIVQLAQALQESDRHLQEQSATLERAERIGGMGQ